MARMIGVAAIHASVSDSSQAWERPDVARNNAGLCHRGNLASVR